MGAGPGRLVAIYPAAGITNYSCILGNKDQNEPMHMQLSYCNYNVNEKADGK